MNEQETRDDLITKHNGLIDNAVSFIENLITCLHAIEYHEIEFQLNYLEHILIDGKIEEEKDGER